MSGFAGMMASAKQPIAAPAGNTQTSLLLHGDGANNSTVITDSSTYAMTMTSFGAVKNSTTVAKFGTASIFMDGATPYDYLTAPNTGERFTFGAGNFTVEGWAYPTSFAKTSILAAMWFPGNAAQCSWTIQIVATTGRFNGYISTGATGFDITGVSTAKAFTINTWNHWAITRVGNVFTSYIGGIRAGTQTVAGTNPTSTAPLYIGYRESNNNFTGYMDDFRITKGTGLYSGATYTVPTAAFTG